MSANDPRKTKCKHPKPDLLHLRDEQKADDTFVRVYDCVICGRYEVPLDIDALEKYARLQLQFLGQVIVTSDEKMAEIREREHRQ